jgi:hypothetical protein
MKIKDNHIIKKGILINEKECLFFTKTNKMYLCKYEYEVFPTFIPHLNASINHNNYYYAIYKKTVYYCGLYYINKWEQDKTEIGRYKIKEIKIKDVTDYLHLII